ncbi:uncharacterized protein PG998_004656 [Apiospora kogelbergensis]|uniref:uncharacterized protein n=1 Tax=Apiospora kogelbergensis TaxID=1337665 RepID=UPI00312E0943
MKVKRCGIHGYHEHLGIDSDKISFFWALESEEEDACQVSYRVVVAGSPDGTAPEIANFPGEHLTVLWDSGKVSSSDQRNISCHGLGPAWQCLRRATQRVLRGVSEEQWHAAPYSMNQTYMPHTSLIFRTWFEDEPNRWKGVWIGDRDDKPIYLRKSLHLEQKPVRAVVFASGLGHFNFVCNGDPSARNGHVLDPGWTNYHRTVQFVAYDVSDILRQGENVLGAHVGNGFYAGDQGADRFFWPAYEDNTYVRYGNELCFFAELHLFYGDGRRETITTGPDWKVRKSATTLANIYSSETTDFRSYPQGWDSPGFREEDDSHGGGWKPVTPVTGPRGKLKYQSQPPVTLHETFEPVSRKILQPGTVSFDLGQNASTMVKIKLLGPAGSEVKVRFSETVDEAGRVLMPDPLFKAFEQDVFCKITLAGSGLETWQPDFCFTSARYIQVEGVTLEADDGSGLPVVRSLVGQHVSSAARRLGHVKTDKEDVNALINMCYWSFASNLFSYHTDCPQIEKFGWLEVTHLLAPATQYIRDMESLYTKILDDILDAQEPNGLVPTMAPEMRYMCGPLHDTITWGGAIALLPEILRYYYGATDVFARAFTPCVRYMEYLHTKERDGGLIEHGLGDWGRDIAFGNNQANIETAVYYKCLRNVQMMAKELGRPEEESRFQRWADRIYATYNERLLVTKGAQHPYAFYTSRDQLGSVDRNMVAQAVALQFGLVPADHKSDVERAFLEACSDAGNRIEAGEIGLKYLWNTLADLERPDIVLEMARQQEHPSYMRFIRLGETTLNEFWQDACRSKCHDMLGTIYEWFYAAVLGLKPETEAYRTWTVRPPLSSEFQYVEGRVDCPYGEINITFDRRASEGDKQTIKMKVSVPMSTTAFLLLPNDDSSVDAVRQQSDGLGNERNLKGKRISLGPGRWDLVLHP